MRSDKVEVKSSGEGVEKAVSLATKVGTDKGLGPKEIRELQLMAEETLGMVRSITHEFTAMFWIEEKGGVYSINLASDTRLDIFQREDLLQKSTTGKNILARGIMGKIKNVFEICATDIDTLDQMDVLKYGVIYGGTQDSIVNASTYTPIWSFNSYAEGITDIDDDDDDAADDLREACSELEYSIVSNISDEIQVGVSRDTVQLKILKDFK